MKKKKTHDVVPVQKEKPNVLPGYPVYPPEEDIFVKFRKDVTVNDEELSSITSGPDVEKVNTRDDKNYDDDRDDLDVPGSELDNDQENIGSEDEENNYYSIGGDNHNDLEENKGE